MTPNVGKGMWVAGWLVCGAMAHGGFIGLLENDWVQVAWCLVPIPFFARYWWKQV